MDEKIPLIQKPSNVYLNDCDNGSLGISRHFFWSIANSNRIAVEEMLVYNPSPKRGFLLLGASSTGKTLLPNIIKNNFER